MNGSWVWELMRAVAGRGDEEDEAYLNGLFMNGWEPFAVTVGKYEGYVYHLRRMAPVAGS